MKNFKIEIAVIVVVLLVMIAGVYSYRHYRSTTRPVDTKPMPAMPMDPDLSSVAVQATKTYSNGVFHISGTFSLPTPCHTLDVTSLVAESYPEQVSINMTVQDPGNPCVQVIDERAWSIDVKASEQATFRANVNGQVANLVWLPV